jgi:hypothetical protein
LANDNTIVMTAADAHHPSFGCAPQRDWTYFGDAFFRQSLHPGADFKNAFDHARVLIHRWEMRDHAVPSNPQGSFGSALEAAAAWRRFVSCVRSLAVRVAHDETVWR